MPRDEPGDEGASGPPPNPLDRPWVHPTEMFARSRGTRPPGAGPGAARRSRRRDLALALGAGIAGALVTVLVLAAAGAFGDGSAGTRSAPRGPVRDGMDTAARLAAAASGSVVGIVAATPTGPRQASGVCVDAHRVLTTAAAVDGATEIALTTRDGATVPASVVGRDDVTGLVLLETEGQELRPASLAAEDELEVGSWVLAVGAGDGARPWVTTGIVSSLGGWVDDGTGVRRAGMITTNATTASSAHGGALLDSEGRVVGILSATGGSPATVVATPIATARSVADQLARTGYAAHGALGVRAVDESDPSGARITEVLDSTGAATAGVETGDVIVAIDGRSLRDTAALVTEVRARMPGSRVRLRLVRGVKTMTVEAVLDEAAPQERLVTATTVQPAEAR